MFNELEVDKKKELFDGDIEALVLRGGFRDGAPWTIEDLQTTAGGGAPARASVRLRHADGHVIERGVAAGPVDAAIKSIEAATGIDAALRKFELRSVSAGEDAQGEAIVYVEYNERTYRGSSVSTDIVEASARAFLEVINHIELARKAGARVRDESEPAAHVSPRPPYEDDVREGVGPPCGGPRNDRHAGRAVHRPAPHA